ncbi:MAG: T9SS type A sorting domain-containing protein [Saprospiraceae bacterium]
MDQALLSGRQPFYFNNKNIILAGNFLYKSDHFILGLNENNDSIFYKVYPGSYLVRLTESLIRYNEALYLIGFVQTQNFDLDVFIQKIDTIGNKIWEKTYGIPSRDETGRAAIIEDDGLTVMISESYDPTPTIKNDTRYWIRFMHIDTSGSIIRDWKEEVTNHEGWAGTLLKYNDDYIYTTNTIGQETNFGPVVGGEIVRRDSSFNIVWRKQYGVPDSQFTGLGDMVLSRDGHLLVTGQNVDSSMNFNAARIMKICLDGSVQCEIRDTGIALPNGQSLNLMEGIVESESGSIYAVGYTYKNANFYEGLLLKINKDGCIDTICTTTAIEDQIHLEEDKVLLYPNPTRDELTIQFSDEIPKNTFVRIYDTYGRELKSSHLYESKNILDLSGLPNGVYMLQISDEKHLIATRKFIKKE